MGMAYSYNKTTLVGKIGGIHTFANGIRLSIATTKSFKKQDGTWENKTVWHNVVYFNKNAETVAKFAVKGMNVCIIGELDYNEYTDKDNIKRTTTSIIGDTFIPCGESNGNSSNNEYNQPSPAESYSQVKDDVPF